MPRKEAQFAHRSIIPHGSRGWFDARDFSVVVSLFLRRRKTRKIGKLFKNSSAGANWTLGGMRQTAILTGANRRVRRDLIRGSFCTITRGGLALQLDRHFF
jgi:hypothetical protein